MDNWYKTVLKEAQESSSWVDSQMAPGDIARTRDLKQWSPGTSQGLSDYSAQGLGIESERGTFGIEVKLCGEEPNVKGGCGRPIDEFGKRMDYSVTIGDEKYRAYECKHCTHSIKPFNIDFSPHPEKFKKPKPKRRRVRRLSGRITSRDYRTAASPSVPTPGGYNNPANSPWGRLDMSEDARVIPWKKVQEDFDDEYDTERQRANKKEKVIKIKGQDGKDRYVKVKETRTSGDGIMPSNVKKHRGKIKQQPRYNPTDPRGKEHPGSWPHNRDPNEGWYNSGVNKNKFDTDFRERVMTWDQYIRERGNNMLTLVKPY